MGDDIAGDAGDARNGPRIAIVGAGLTGLLAAHALKKNGFDTTVFDQDESLGARDRDWSIFIHWAMPVFSELLPAEVLKDISKAVCNPHVDYNEENENFLGFIGDTGKPLFNNKAPGARRISRQNLRRVLVHGLDIRWGRKIADLAAEGNGPVQVTFENGETVEVDYLLGTDGARSKVRQILFNNDEAGRAVPSGYAIASCLPRYDDARIVESFLKIHPVHCLTMSSSGATGWGVMYADDPADKSTWTMFVSNVFLGTRAAWPAGAAQGRPAMDYMKAALRGFAEPFQTMVDAMPEGSRCTIDEMNFWMPTPWDNRSGRVTLAGDSAHAMLIFRGQGFQNAIIDAKNYLSAMIKIRDQGSPRKEVFDAYDAEMVERGAKVVTQVNKEAALAMNPETIHKMTMVRKGHGRLDDE